VNNGKSGQACYGVKLFCILDIHVYQQREAALAEGMLTYYVHVCFSDLLWISVNWFRGKNSMTRRGF